MMACVIGLLFFMRMDWGRGMTCRIVFCGAIGFR